MHDILWAMQMMPPTVPQDISVCELMHSFKKGAGLYGIL